MSFTFISDLIIINIIKSLLISILLQIRTLKYRETKPFPQGQTVKKTVKAGLRTGYTA